MKLSIVVPQLFYDLIARVLPGFFFLLIIALGIPDFSVRILSLGFNETSNAMDSLGKGFIIAALSYILGWVFLSFVTNSMEKPTYEKAKAKNAESNFWKEKDTKPKSLKAMYQWIRLSHPAAGFRIVKLRAEARMLETSRTAMASVMIVTVLYALFLVYTCFKSQGSLADINWIRLLLTLVAAWIIRKGIRPREERAWENYWGNIGSIYKILHDDSDPIRPIG